MMKNVKNILIVRTDRIGDVVLTTPAVKILRQTYPKARLTMLVQPLTKDLVEENPYLDEVLVDDREHKNRGMAGFWKLVGTIREKKFDMAVIFHTKRRTNLLCFLAGIPVRLGYKDKKFGFLLTHPVEDRRFRGEKHESQYCLDVLRVFGIPCEETEFFVPLHQDAEVWAEQFLAQNSIAPQEILVALHVGASDPSKRWLEEHFAELIDRLLGKYHCKIVLIGEVAIRHITRKVLSLTHGPIFDLTGMTTISQLASLLKRCAFMVSNDSGPVHVAAALGVPVVSIFTRNQPGINPERWQPLGERATFVSVPPDHSLSFAKAGVTDRHYLAQIKPADVLEAVDGVFKLC